MAHHHIREAGMLTVVDASGPTEAITHCGHVHGWKLKTEKPKELRSGVWSLFHGEPMLFAENPRVMVVMVDQCSLDPGRNLSPP